MRILLVRHPETLENTKNIILGHLPGVLTRIGKEQAKKLAERLKDEKIDYIFSSDLERCVYTANKIAKYHPKINIEFSSLLRERYPGDYQGKSTKDLDWKNLGAKFKEVDFAEHGVESLRALHFRAKDFIDGLKANYSNENILLVGHDVINRALICAIQGRSPKSLSEYEQYDNASLTIAHIEQSGSYVLSKINDTSHL